MRLIGMLVLAAGLALSLSTPSLADDREALLSAMAKSFEAGSFRVRMTEDGRRPQTSVMEFQEPDRFRIVTDDSEIIAVEGVAYMLVAGQTMRVPMNIGKLVERFRSDEEIRKAWDGTTVTAVESETFNGEPATRFDFVVSKPASSNRAWISEETGYMIRMEQTSGSGRRQKTITMDYEDFGQVVINAPQS